MREAAARICEECDHDNCAAAIRALPLPDPPPALADALREHEEAVAKVGAYRSADYWDGPDPRPRAVETRAALLAAMAPAPMLPEHDMEVGPDLRCAAVHVPALLAVPRDAATDESAALRARDLEAKLDAMSLELADYQALARWRASS